MAWRELRSQIQKFFAADGSANARRRPPTRLRIEPLEDRRMLSTVVALTNDNRLLTFDSAAPAVILNAVEITGLASRRDPLVGIDFRPSTGLLYGVTKTQEYLIDPGTGKATLVGPVNPIALKGEFFGFDFNPVVDRLRVVSDIDQNLRINPNTGAVVDGNNVLAGIQADGNLAYAAVPANAGKNPFVSGSAYTNNDNNAATGTTLYGIDARFNTLVIQNPPNTGTLNTVGALGVNTSGQVGFDITTDPAGVNTAYASLTTSRTRFYSINLATGAATLIGNIGDVKQIRDIAVVVPRQPVYAVTSANQLLTFNSAAPGIVLSSTALTGLGAGETIEGIDFRPKTGELYGLGSTGNVYEIDVKTGAVAQVNTATLSGGEFGVDFNPVPDALRIVSDAEQNLRITAGGTGTVNTDGALAYAAGDPNVGQNPNVAGAAYRNNYPGATATTLYGIDTNLDILVTQNPPNAGTLNTVGPLGVNVGSADLVGFDISAGNTAFAALQLEGETVSRFYSINLSTGAATLVAHPDNAGAIVGATIGGSPTITGIAIAPPLVQYGASNTFRRENRGPALVRVIRTGDTTLGVTVNFATTPGTATPFPTANFDYTDVAGSVTFGVGEAIKAFAVPVRNDNRRESTETVNLALTNPVVSGVAATLGARSAALLSILDDENRIKPRLIDDEPNDWWNYGE